MGDGVEGNLQCGTAASSSNVDPEGELRKRSLVLISLPESEVKPCERRADDRARITCILDATDVDSVLNDAF